jgi:hypothetical protein
MAVVVNLVLSALALTFLFIALRDGGPPTIIQGSDQKPKLVVRSTQ